MSSEPQQLPSLSDVNHRFVAKGESLPAVSLPDGTKIQTGTVGALLQNIRAYDRICAGETIEDVTKDELEEMMTVPIPTLVKVGLFDLFPPHEWMVGTSPGKKFVGSKAKEMGY